MQGGAAARTKGRFAADAPRTSVTMALPLLLLMLTLAPQARANDCKFPESWTGRWYLLGKEGPVIANSSSILDRRCIMRDKDKFLTYEETAEGKCYRCTIFTERHKNFIQFRETYCVREETDLEKLCTLMRSDDMMLSLFRLDAEPINCPFSGPPFSFTYNGGHGDCKAPENQAEGCSDGSKLLIKYQACADIHGAESNVEELQCLAIWKESWNMYLVGTLTPSGRVASDKNFRCFVYEKSHRQGKIVYLISQSGEASCNGLTSVIEGARSFVFTKEEKEHVRCKYPSWVTQHHDWHFLDGSRDYHFTTGNSTLKVIFKDEGGTAGREEKVVCHNLEKMHPNDDMHGSKVKLVAHVTSGCDTGYVCMIFHKRDGHVIEVQQSRNKVTMPNEACLFDDPSKQPFATLITSTLHKRSCPQPGRYTVLDLVSSPQLKRRHRRLAKASRLSDRAWAEESNEAAAGPDDCQNADVQIGCTSSGQNEMIIHESCKRSEAAYSCHGSWEEAGTWYTIVSRNKTATEKETLCVSMRLSESTKELPGKVGRVEQQELWLSRPQSLCQRGGAADQWTYKLANQGVCEDLMRAASSSASSSSLTRVSVALSLGATLLSSLLSR